MRLRDAHGLGMHMHLLETRAQAAQSRSYQDGLLPFLAETTDLLAPGLSVAHAVWVPEQQRDLLAERGIVVVHNPASNLMLGSGLMPWADYRRLDVTMALGSDSANTGGAADPFELMRLASTLPRLAEPDPSTWPAAHDALRMAISGGAAALGLAGELGALAPGRLADLALVDLGAGAAPGATSAELLVRHGTPARVRATMVGGRWAYREGTVLAFDESAVLTDFRAAAADLAERAAPDLATARAAAAILATQLAALHAQAGGAAL
jgi:cytosine/adenosine deaminase-related metal-dependent hydrolase